MRDRYEVLTFLIFYSDDITNIISNYVKKRSAIKRTFLVINNFHQLKTISQVFQINLTQNVTSILSQNFTNLELNPTQIISEQK